MGAGDACDERERTHVIETSIAQRELAPTLSVAKASSERPAWFVERLNVQWIQ